MFSTLKVKNIENIQKIIKDNGKPKSHINMTMKGPSRKQVIIPTNDDNKKHFIKESSSHISNINRALKNIKSDVMVNLKRPCRYHNCH